MSAKEPTTIISHWNHRAEDVQVSADSFYKTVEDLLQVQNVEKIKLERVNFSEGGFFSAKREYLQICRGDDIFHVCAAPFGSGFFVSSWLGNVESGLWAWLLSKPIIGPLVRRFIKPLTYYKIDTALMFQSIAQGAVTKALDDMLNAKGLRALSESERKPIMRDLFAQLG
jgi:hypothetical protein